MGRKVGGGGRGGEGEVEEREEEGRRVDAMGRKVGGGGRGGVRRKGGWEGGEVKGEGWMQWDGR